MRVVNIDVLIEEELSLLDEAPPSPTGSLPTSFAVSMPSAAGGTLCDLRTGECVPVPASGEAPWSCEAEGGAVLLLAK